jgi:glutathione peroxidase
MTTFKKIINKTGMVLLLFIGLFTIYFFYANRNSNNMTFRQKIMKAIYPAIMWASKKKTSVQVNETEAQPAVSFYSLQAIANNGTPVSFASFKNKKVLLVNTASDCGFTQQYEDLQKLHEQYADKLIILGFPANDFKEQEKEDDAAIAQFCKINFGVTFPLMQKSSVIKSANQNPVFVWLSDKTKNGWNEQAPSWNFSKYLIDEQGVLIGYFASSISPLSEEIISQINP